MKDVVIFTWLVTDAVADCFVRFIPQQLANKQLRERSGKFE